MTLCPYNYYYYDLIGCMSYVFIVKCMYYCYTCTVQALVHVARTLETQVWHHSIMHLIWCNYYLTL